MRSKLKWTLALFTALVVQVSFAQEKTLSGVVSESGMPLPGVTVIIKGTQNGTQTDLNGKYSLKVNPGDVLEFSFIGLKDAIYTVGTANAHNLNMLADEALLEEVVVTAYGTQSKSSVAGSMGVVKAEEIAKTSASNAVQGMVGKVAGVQVINNNGMPGEPPVVRFRGVGSINASSQPLYVVDGVPYSGDVAAINNNDIESMSFLKDASAAALYGNRGANGVIIITTKKGKAGESKVTFSTKVGISQRAAKEYDIMKSPQEYYEGYFTALRNTYMNSSKPLSYEDASIAASQNLIDGSQGLGYNNYNVPNDQIIDPATGRLNPNAKLLYSEDWNDYLFKEGLFTQTHLSISGGNDKTTHLFALGYEKNDGYVVNSGLEKITARVNVDTKINDTFKFGTNLGYTHMNQQYLDGYRGGSTYSSPFFWTRKIAPIYPVHAYDNQGQIIRDAEGNAMYDDGSGEVTGKARPYGDYQNPYATAINDYKRIVSDNLFANAYVEATLFDGLKFKYTVTGDLYSTMDRSMDTPLYGDAMKPNGRAQFENYRQMSVTQQQLLTYNKWFGDHSFDVLLGHESLERKSDNVYVHRTNLLFPDSPFLNHAAVLVDGEGGNKTYTLEGYFARLNYGYNNKYYVNASIRRDASSRFAPGANWGTFYGVGAAWRISQENFLKDVSWIDELKIKGSYGEQGNDRLLNPDTGLELVNPYQDSYVVITSLDPNAPISVKKTFAGNRDVTWETNKNLNIGFEGAFFNSRLNVEAEYFERKVSNMLFMLPRPAQHGFSLVPMNTGDMNNIGVEFTVDGDIIRTEDVRLNLFANFTNYKNKVTALPSGRDIIDGIYIQREGESLYTYRLKEFLGVNPENGNSQFVKVDADTGNREVTEVWDEATYQVIDKNALPKMYGGFGFKLDVKGFDLGVDFAYQLGGYGYDSGYMQAFVPDAGQNLHRDFSKTWTPDNKTASMPRVDVEDPLNNYGTSTLGLIKSDFLSLQNITLGYNFDKTVLDALRLDGLRVYANVDNVALWSKRQGYDPRMSFTGRTDNRYSILRTIAFGVNLQF